MNRVRSFKGRLAAGGLPALAAGILVTVVLAAASSASAQMPGGSSASAQPLNPQADKIKPIPRQRFDIDYSLGPSVPAQVELWYTDDRSATWKLYGLDADRVSPVSFTAPHEGLYGFFIIARNKSGASDKDPAAGTEPMFWCFVDWHRPVVQVTGPIPAVPLDGGTGQVLLKPGEPLTLSYTVVDDNLVTNPVKLEYRQLDEAWKLIAANQPNVGQYVWTVPASVEGPILVRVMAMDLSGNLGVGSSKEMQIVRAEKPLPPSIAVEPKGAGGQPTTGPSGDSVVSVLPRAITPPEMPSPAERPDIARPPIPGIEPEGMPAEKAKPPTPPDAGAPAGRAEVEFPSPPQPTRPPQPAPAAPPVEPATAVASAATDQDALGMFVLQYTLPEPLPSAKVDPTLHKMLGAMQVLANGGLVKSQFGVALQPPTGAKTLVKYVRVYGLIPPANRRIEQANVMERQVQENLRNMDGFVILFRKAYDSGLPQEPGPGAAGGTAVAAASPETRGGMVEPKVALPPSTKTTAPPAPVAKTAEPPTAVAASTVPKPAPTAPKVDQEKPAAVEPPGISGPPVTVPGPAQLATPPGGDTVASAGGPRDIPGIELDRRPPELDRIASGTVAPPTPIGPAIVTDPGKMTPAEPELKTGTPPRPTEVPAAIPTVSPGPTIPPDVMATKIVAPPPPEAKPVPPVETPRDTIKPPDTAAMRTPPTLPTPVPSGGLSAAGTAAPSGSQVAVAGKSEKFPPPEPKAADTPKIEMEPVAPKPSPRAADKFPPPVRPATPPVVEPPAAPGIAPDKLAAAGAAYRQGLAAQAGNKYPEAAAFYQQAIAANPGMVEAVVNLAGVQVLQKDLVGAEINYTQAVNLDPTRATAWYGLGRVQVARGNYQSAQMSLGRLLRLAPTDVAGWVLYGDACRGVGENNQALTAWGQAAALAPDTTYGKIAKDRIARYGGAAR